MLNSLQKIKTRLFTTSGTTAGVIGATAYLSSVPAAQLTQNLESAVGTFLAAILMATAPPVANAFIGIATNLISGDLYERFTRQKIYKQIPSEANLYQASFIAFQSILNEVIEQEKDKADRKQVQKLRDITFKSWLELVSLDEQTDDVSAVAKGVLEKFTDEKITANQFLQSQNDLLSRQDWLILLLRLLDKFKADDDRLPIDSELQDKILTALETNFTPRLESVFSAHQESFQKVTLQLWKTLFGKLEDIHGEIKDFREEFRTTISNNQPATPKPKPQGLINLSREKNDYFVEQSNVFARLDAELRAHHLAYLHGTHGLGKTTTLNEYARAREAEYDFVFYVLATEATLEGELARFADEFLDGISAENTPAQKAALVKAYLEENARWAQADKNWLIIFDNLESAARITQYFPKSAKGDCLYAANEKLFIGNDREVGFAQFSPEEAELFVFQRLNDAAEARHADIPATDLTENRKLIAQLGRLPLALNIATAYLLETKISIDDYVELLKANVQKFLRYKDAHKASQHDTAFDAFFLTLDKVSNFRGDDADGAIIGKLAKTFLDLLIFCAPEDIPEELIKDTLFRAVATSATATPQNILFRETVAVMKSYGLIKEKQKPFRYKEKFAEPQILADGTTAHWEEKETEINVFDTYRTLQDVLSVRLKPAAKKSLLEQLLIVFNSLLPKPDITTWEILGKYTVHAFSITEQAKTLGISNHESWRGCNLIGMYLYEIAQYHATEYFFRRGKTIAEVFYGAEHKNTAESYNNLAELYRSQGEYAKAEPLLLKALQVSEQALGKQHPTTAASYNNLAGLHDSQGEYGKAELLYLKALQISEQALGEQHPTTAGSYNNLAGFYFERGNLKLAGEYQQKSLTVLLANFGENHPNVALSCGWLGTFYEKEEKYREALDYFYKAREIFLRFFTAEHPHVKNLQTHIDRCERLIGKKSYTENQAAGDSPESGFIERAIFSIRRLARKLTQSQ